MTWRNLWAVVSALLLLPLSAMAAPPAADWSFATVIYSAYYVDTPSMVLLPDGTIVAGVTYNPANPEGNEWQRIGVTRSTDNGATWSTLVSIEPGSGPEASWLQLWRHEPSSLIYGFYVYNFEDVRSIPYSTGTGTSSRVDAIGKIAYKTSSDGGVTWSARTLITLPVKGIDQRNPFNGSKQLLWLAAPPMFINGQLYLGFAKRGTVLSGNPFADTEAFVLRIDVAADGSLSNFQELPTTSVGIKAPLLGSVTPQRTEEPSVYVRPDGTIAVVARTDAGRLAEAWSTDGSTFTTDWARQSNCIASGSPCTVYQPTGPGFMWPLPDGRLLLWTYNNAGPGNLPRNPVWYRIGALVGDRVQWGPPYALMFSPTSTVGIGYPSILIVGSDILFAASDKSSARLLRFHLADF